MARNVGRNEQCPCGSGKKFKKCHGATGDRASVPGSEVKPAPGTISVQMGQMGLPGQHQHIITVNQFRDPADDRNIGGPQGLPGKYKVTFVLGRPGFNLLPEGQYSFAPGLRGDSHLAIAKPAFSPPGNPDADQIMIRGTTEDGNFEFSGFPNQRGFLGKFVSEPFDAVSFHDAERKAHRALASSLSHWSAHLDIPIFVAQVESVEVRTGNTQTSILTAHSEVPLAITPTANLQPEFRGYTSLYREALNSNSSVYQFLCLFKMIEAMLKRRARLGAEARRAGKTLTREHETIPASPDAAIRWLNAIFPIRRSWDAMALSSIFPNEALGKSCKYVIDKVLYPLRVDVAHAISDQSGELTLTVDELLHTQNINKWLPLTKCIVRRMLKNDFPADFLTYLQEDGTIIP
jgi:methylamine utilization protein MauJ/SEC-C motif-containing protein